MHREQDFIIHQMAYDISECEYSAHCAICSKELKRKRRGLIGQGAVIRSMKLRFNQCHSCLRFVCDDCFVGEFALCTDCMKEHKRSGFTTTGREITF